jgi:hypothetical protein
MIVLNPTDYPGWNETEGAYNISLPNTTYEACGSLASYNPDAPTWPASDNSTLGNPCVNVT